MLLPGRARRILATVERATCNDDRHLAGLYATFNRLCSGEPFPASEQVTLRTRARVLLRRWAATAVIAAVVLGVAVPATVALATGPVRGREPGIEVVRGRVHIPAGRVSAAH
jgi:hypothetical protein